MADQEAGAVNRMARAEMVANLFSSPLLCFGDRKAWEASQAPTIRKVAASEGERPGLGSLALVLRFAGDQQ